MAKKNVVYIALRHHHTNVPETFGEFYIPDWDVYNAQITRQNTLLHIAGTRKSQTSQTVRVAGVNTFDYLLSNLGYELSLYHSREEIKK